MKKTHSILTFALFAFFAVNLPAQVKLSELPTATSAADADTSVIVQGGVTKKVTIANVFTARVNSGDFGLTGNLVFEGSTVDAFEGTISVTDPTVDWILRINGNALTGTRTITLPDSNITITTAGAALLDDADAAAMRTTLGLKPLSTLSVAGANYYPLSSGVDTWTTAAIAPYMQTVLTSASATEARTNLGAQQSSANLTTWSATALDTDSTFAANSDSRVASQKALKTALRGKLGDCINALDYGVVSGATDNSTALQNAINAAFSANHKTLFIPAGTYRFATTLQIPHTIRIFGETIGDINGYTPSPLYPWGTKLFYDGTGNAINIPLAISPEFYFLEIKATNTSTTPGTVGAGIFASNIDATYLTSYLSNPPTPGWPYQTGQGLVLDHVYIHEFDVNIKTSFCSAQYWINCNFSSARTTNVVVNYGSYSGNSDVMMINCFVGGGAVTQGTGFATKNARLQIHNMWLYDVEHAGYFDASTVNFVGLNLENIRGNYGFKTKDASILNFFGGTLAPGSNFDTRVYPLIDLTDGSGNGTCNLFGVNGTKGDVKTIFGSSVVTCIPASGNQYETAYTGGSLVGTYSLGISGTQINNRPITTSRFKANATNTKDAVSFGINADNTGLYGDGTYIQASVTGTQVMQFFTNGMTGVPSNYYVRSGPGVAANTIKLGFSGENASGVGYPAASKISLMAGGSDRLIVDGDGMTLRNASGVDLPVPKILSSTSVNAKFTGATNLYTVPTGKTAVVTNAIVRVTADTAITIGPTLGVGVASGEDDIFASTALTSLTSTGKIYGLTLTGNSLVATSTQIIKLGIDAASTGTAQTVVVDLVGYIY